MSNLSAIMLYKAKFSIASTEENTDLLWNIVLHIKSWQTGKWNCNGQTIIPTYMPKWSTLKTGGRIYSADNSTVYIESEFCVNHSERYWACKITEKRKPAPGCAPRQLVTEIGYEQTKQNKADFSCVVSYSDLPGFIGPCESIPSSSLPRLITNILSDSTIRCTCGFDDLSGVPQKLTQDDWPEFWKRITSPERELPYVYISPIKINYETDETVLLINPNTLAKAVCGNALVFYADTAAFVKEMNGCCDANYNCYGGAIRIYQPNIKKLSKEDSIRHRFLTAANINEIGCDQIIQIFRRALSQNVYFYESFFRIDDCKRKIADIARQRRLMEIQDQHIAQMDELKNEKFDEAVEEEQGRLEAEAREEILRAELTDSKREKYNLQCQIETYRSAANRNEGLETALQSRNEIHRYPKSPFDIIAYFSKMFGDRIAFSADAIKSAKDCSIPPEDLWKVFFNLATVMRDLLLDDCSNTYDRFKSITGIDCSRGEGTMTRKDRDLMKQFDTCYKDEIIDIEPHITFPRISQSIHFGFSDNERKIVVGHCGKHLEIYSTQKK